MTNGNRPNISNILNPNQSKVMKGSETSLMHKEFDVTKRINVNEKYCGISTQSCHLSADNEHYVQIRTFMIHEFLNDKH